MKPVATDKSNLLQTWMVMKQQSFKTTKAPPVREKESWGEQSVLRDFYSETFCQ